MDKYIITEQDIQELEQYKGCNDVDREFYNICQRLINKMKWSISDLRIINQFLDDNLGHLLYQLLEVRARQPLFMKYYGADRRIQPQRSLNDLLAIRELILSGDLTPEDYDKYGLRVRSMDDLLPDHERKTIEIEQKSAANNASAISVKLSNKKNTHLAKK
jgi:hypothetical protein